VTPLLPTRMSGLLFPTGFCPDIESHTVHPASAWCPEPRLFGGRDGGLWEWPDSSCHSLVGSFNIEFFSSELPKLNCWIELPNWIATQNCQTESPIWIAKLNYQSELPNWIADLNYQTKLPNWIAKLNCQTELLKWTEFAKPNLICQT
jgi:hypothetical protein